MTTLFPIEFTEPATPKEARGDYAPQYLRLDAEVDGELPALPAATLIRGRAAEALDLLPAESVRTVVTSPPYWSLRDYDIGDPFGRDDTLRDYVASIVADFRKLRRVLRGDGTVWLCAGSAGNGERPLFVRHSFRPSGGGFPRHRGLSIRWYQVSLSAAYQVCFQGKMLVHQLGYYLAPSL